MHITQLPCRYLMIPAAVMGLLSFHTPKSAMAESDESLAAQIQAYRQAMPVVSPAPDGNLYLEAEEFVVTDGWLPRRWGSNYFAATFANTFLSRQAYLETQPQAQQAIATRRIRVDSTGDYLVLARYEALYRFQTQFTIEVEQDGKTVFSRRYGGLDDIKIWAFSQKLKAEVAWGWGAVENIVWEGHDARATLAAGEATVRLIAAPQPEPAARRNVDLVMLTQDIEDVEMRIEKERYLPLDGLLTQQGDLYMRLTVHADSAPMSLSYKPGTEHSPYWVHLRKWPRANTTPVVAPGETSDWIDVGQVLDSMNHGQWLLQAKAADGAENLHYTVHVALPTADGGYDEIAAITQTDPAVELAYFGDTRYRRRILPRNQVLVELLAAIRESSDGSPRPQRFPVYGYTFDAPSERVGFLSEQEATERRALIAAFEAEFSLRPTHASTQDEESPYIDLRAVKTEVLAEKLTELGPTRLASLRVVSMGDEIGLPKPSATDHEGFRAWLTEQGIPAAELLGRPGEMSEVTYQPAYQGRQENPRLFYWSNRYAHAYGIAAVKVRTDIIRALAPNAQVGANFSPHHGGDAHAYLGESYKWVGLFRAGGMTLPWSEDYAWQLPLGSQQMNTINLDLARAAIRGRATDPIHFYVMPHSPGNTPHMWRRHFYSALTHGMKELNLFEFRPTQDAYTENYVEGPEMYDAVHQALGEVARVEEFLLDGAVRNSSVGLWFGETGDIWLDTKTPFGAAKRSLYLAIRQQAGPLDVVVETDALDGTLQSYQVLYLQDRHVSLSASQAIADWVAAGGTLITSAGAGESDEYDRPNRVFREVFGVRYSTLAVDESPLRYLKQDLPFVDPMDQVTWGEQTIPVFGVRTALVEPNGEIVGTYRDGSAAITETAHGKGHVIALGFLPGFSYLAPALPRRPVDRGTSDDAYTHFLPRDVDAAVASLIGAPGLATQALRCSDPLVTYHIIDSPHGTAVPLASWRTNEPMPVTLTWRDAPPHKTARLASGGPVTLTTTDRVTTLQFDLRIGDVLVLAP